MTDLGNPNLGGRKQNHLILSSQVGQIVVNKNSKMAHTVAVKSPVNGESSTSSCSSATSGTGTDCSTCESGRNSPIDSCSKCEEKDKCRVGVGIPIQGGQRQPAPVVPQSNSKFDNFIWKHLVKWGSPQRDKLSSKEKLSSSLGGSSGVGSSGNNSRGNSPVSSDQYQYPNYHHHHHNSQNVQQDQRYSSSDPTRERSRSLDVSFSTNVRHAPTRRRRLSGDIIGQRDRDTLQTYTIYESIITDGNRRASLHSHRPSDVSLDPAYAAILFRDSRGLPVADPFLERLNLNCAEGEENEILVKFFKFHKCYDLIPTSAKLVVFDTQLLVKKAFFALVYNGVRAAPLWCNNERQFVGMLTITDFIRVLHAMYHDSSGKMSELEEHRIETWRRRFLQDKTPLIFIDPDASLFDAICSLVNNRIHRLPVIDRHTGNVLHILTHKRILKFLFLYINEIPRPSFLNKHLSEVKIGTFDNVETAREDTPIIQALQKFLDRRVSALPIVDDQNRLLDIYARFDVINLAAEKTYNNLDITLKQANEHRNEWFEGVHKCTLNESLFVIMEKIVKAEVHRLVVVDGDEGRVVGVISLSDILQYLVMRPELKEVSDQEIQDTLLKDQKELDLQMDNNSMRHQPLYHHHSSDENCSNNPPIIEEEDEKT